MRIILRIAVLGEFITGCCSAFNHTTNKLGESGQLGFGNRVSIGEQAESAVLSRLLEQLNALV